MDENPQDMLADLAFTSQLVTLAAALESARDERDGSSFAHTAEELRRLAESQAADVFAAVIRRRSGRD